MKSASYIKYVPLMWPIPPLNLWSSSEEKNGVGLRWE